MSANPYAPPTAHVDDVVVPDVAGAPPFFAVSMTKLAVLSICTVGLYQLYWFYAQWRHVKARERSDILPAARAFFAVFYCYQLFARVRDAGDERGMTTSLAAIPLAAGWIVCTIASRLPEPYWLVTFAAFMFLLPVQARANRINEIAAPGHDRNNRFSVWNWIVTLFGGLFFALVLIGVFLPPAPP